MNIIEFLSSNKEFLNIRAIERECEITDGLLRKAVNGKKKLPDKYHKSIISLLRRLSFDDVPENIKVSPRAEGWLKVDITKYKKVGRYYTRDGKKYETKFDGGFFVKEL